MARQGLKWALLCASLLLVTLATSSVLAQDVPAPVEDAPEAPGDKQAPAATEHKLKDTKLCKEAVDKGEVKDMDECYLNLQNGFNPDGTPKGVNCGDGLIVPIWRPYTKLTGGDRFGRGLLYILLMVWLFIGVAIVSDRFMESIEMITAQEKEVTVKDPRSGKNQVVIVNRSLWCNGEHAHFSRGRPGFNSPPGRNI